MSRTANHSTPSRRTTSIRYLFDAADCIQRSLQFVRQTQIFNFFARPIGPSSLSSLAIFYETDKPELPPCISLQSKMNIALVKTIYIKSILNGSKDIVITPLKPPQSPQTTITPPNNYKNLTFYRRSKMYSKKHFRMYYPLETCSNTRTRVRM